MLGLDAPCGHCPMKFMNGEEKKEIEVDDGSRVFSLKARYTTWNGKSVFIEYGRDITDTKAGQLRYADQIRGILENIPEGQGVFHMDLTADKWISSGGAAQNARDMQDLPDVDTLIREKKIPLPDGHEIAVTVSIGYTSRPDDCQEMISQADRAMYMAKKQGKNQTACLD